MHWAAMTTPLNTSTNIGLIANKETLSRALSKHEGKEPIRVGSNSHEKVKTFENVGSLLINLNSIHDGNVGCKLEIHVIIQSKTFVFSISL